MLHGMWLIECLNTLGCLIVSQFSTPENERMPPPPPSPQRTEPEDHKLYHQLLNQQNQCEPNHNELNQKYEEPNRHEIDGCLDDW